MGKKDKKKTAAHKERVAQKAQSARKTMLTKTDGSKAVEEGGQEQQEEGTGSR